MKILILLSLCFNTCFAFEVLFPKRLKTKLNEQHLKDTIIYAYKRIKINAKIKYVSESEINKKIKSGHFDAIASKVEHEKLLTHANKVEPPMIKDYQVNLWSTKSDEKIKNLKVGYIKGVVAYEKAIEKHKNEFSEVKTFINYFQLLSSLEQGEINSILLSKLALEYNIPLSLKHNLEQTKKNLYSANLYHYVNKKHKDLDRKISRQFRKLNRKKKLDLMDYYFNVFIPRKINN